MPPHPHARDRVGRLDCRQPPCRRSRTDPDLGLADLDRTRSDRRQPASRARAPYRVGSRRAALDLDAVAEAHVAVEAHAVNRDLGLAHRSSTTAARRRGSAPTVVPYGAHVRAEHVAVGEEPARKLRPSSESASTCEIFSFPRRGSSPLVSRVDDRASLARRVGAVRVAEVERDRVLVGRRAGDRHASFVAAHAGTMTDHAPAPEGSRFSRVRQADQAGVVRGCSAARRAGERAGDLPPFAITSRDWYSRLGHWPTWKCASFSHSTSGRRCSATLA